jgi:cytochrome P450
MKSLTPDQGWGRLPPLDPAQFARDPIAYMRGIYQKRGRLAAFENGGQQIVFAFGPEYNQQLLTKPDLFYANLFTLPGPKGSALRRIGLGLITENGAHHKKHRRLLLPAFHKQTVEAYSGSLVATTGQMLDTWRAGHQRDLFREMSQLALHITSTVLFGLDDAQEALTVGTVMEEVLERSTALGLSGLLPSDAPADAYRELLVAAERSERNVIEMIRRKRARSVQGEDVLSVLIRAHDEDGTRLSDAELIGQASMLFGAANRTTASALTWTLFLLAQHPAVMADLFDELDGTLHGEAPTPAGPGPLPLLDRVIKESLRLLPPVVFNTRTATGPAELGPYRLAKGSTVVFSHYVTHHMPELFPQPEHFLPDRWLTIAPSPYAYLPYSAGPRLCIGAALAGLTIKTALAMILQQYRLTLVPYATVNRRVTVTLVPDAGLPVLIGRQDRCFESSPVCGNIHEMVALDETPVRPYRLAA